MFKKYLCSRFFQTHSGNPCKDGMLVQILRRDVQGIARENTNLCAGGHPVCTACGLLPRCQPGQRGAAAVHLHTEPAAQAPACAARDCSHTAAVGGWEGGAQCSAGGDQRRLLALMSHALGLGPTGSSRTSVYNRDCVIITAGCWPALPCACNWVHVIVCHRECAAT